MQNVATVKFNVPSLCLGVSSTMRVLLWLLQVSALTFVLGCLTGWLAGWLVAAGWLAAGWFAAPTSTQHTPASQPASHQRPSC